MRKSFEEGNVMLMRRFFTDTQEYTLKQENKLRFWQALCIEVSYIFGYNHIADEVVWLGGSGS